MRAALLIPLIVVIAVISGYWAGRTDTASRRRFIPLAEGGQSGIWVSWQQDGENEKPIPAGWLMFDTKTGALCRAWDWHSPVLPRGGRTSLLWDTCQTLLRKEYIDERIRREFNR